VGPLLGCSLDPALAIPPWASPPSMGTPRNFEPPSSELGVIRETCGRNFVILGRVQRRKSAKPKAVVSADPPSRTVLRAPALLTWLLHEDGVDLNGESYCRLSRTTASGQEEPFPPRWLSGREGSRAADHECATSALSPAPCKTSGPQCPTCASTLECFASDIAMNAGLRANG